MLDVLSVSNSNVYQKELTEYLNYIYVSVYIYIYIYKLCLGWGHKFRICATMRQNDGFREK